MASAAPPPSTWLDLPKEFFEITAAGKSNFGKQELLTVMHDFGRLPCLQRVKYACPADGFLSLKLPPGCLVSATVFYWAIAKTNLHPSAKLSQADSAVCQHLGEVEVIAADDHLPYVISATAPREYCTGYAPFSKGMDLSPFRHCGRLQRLSIRSSITSHWTLTGLDELPPSLECVQAQEAWCNMGGFRRPDYCGRHVKRAEKVVLGDGKVSYRLHLAPR
ncbi:hypothetical protein WJX72_009636 [[Myrmecia] bisecta]|uniref:Uncharacterized protein n=1 Tax=[Myrmecia] bisecta TaxID=41462 RepID=A0AAW1QSB3_9CHLO